MLFLVLDVVLRGDVFASCLFRWLVLIDYVVLALVVVVFVSFVIFLFPLVVFVFAFVVVVLCSCVG